MPSLNSYDFAFLSGLLCGSDCMQKEMQRELEKMRHELEKEMRREAETFNRFVGLKNRTHELANMLWAAIQTIRDRDTRISVMNEIRAGFDRMEASDRAKKAQMRGLTELLSRIGARRARLDEQRMAKIAADAAEQRALVLRDAVREVLVQRDAEVAALQQRFERRLAEIAATSERQRLITRDAMVDFVAGEIRERDEQIAALLSEIATLKQRLQDGIPWRPLSTH